jgi:hypothetical protein
VLLTTDHVVSSGAVEQQNTHVRSAATIRLLLDVLLKEINLRKQKKEKKNGERDGNTK